MQCRERMIDTLSVRRHQPATPTHRKKDENGKNSRRQKLNKPLRSIGPDLKTHQSRTIEYRVSKIVPQIYRNLNKSPAVLQCSGAMRLIRIPMCHQSTACYPHWNIWPYGTYCTMKRVHRITPDLVEHTQYCHRSPMCNVTVQHTCS